jgi:hypothetical protein
MANKSWLPVLGALEVDVVGLYGSITFGSTGAVSASSGKGIASVVRNSAGNYTITLDDSYQALLWAGVTLLHSASSDPSTVGVEWRVASADVLSAKTVVIQSFASDDGAAADPASGAQVLLKFDLRNSTVS